MEMTIQSRRDDQDGSRFKLWSENLILSGLKTQRILIITDMQWLRFIRIYQENKDGCMNDVHSILRMEGLLTGTLGRDRSRRRHLKNLKTTGRRCSGNLKVQRDLEIWKRKGSNGKKESPLYTIRNLCVNGQDWIWDFNLTANIWFRDLAAKSE